MSEDLEDLDALFDSLAAQPAGGGQAQAVSAPPVVPAAAAVVATLSPVPEVKPVPASEVELPMYDRLGKIVRELHDALRELGHERSLFDAVHEVFDSQERLKYIASLTEQAANKVLNAVDESLPIQDQQAERAKALRLRWDEMYQGKLDVEAFKQLAADSRDFTATIEQESEIMKARLMEIMMAQDFQDITGQIIKKVVTLTGNLEGQLMQLLRDYAPNLGPRNKEVVDLLSGPNVPTASMVQGDVDSLLADLGF